MLSTKEPHLIKWRKRDPRRKDIKILEREWKKYMYTPTPPCCTWQKKKDLLAFYDEDWIFTTEPKGLVLKSYHLIFLWNHSYPLLRLQKEVWVSTLLKDFSVPMILELLTENPTVETETPMNK